MRRTKIVCTLGPATASAPSILALSQAGMDVARLNFSHGEPAWHAERYRLLRELEATLGRPFSILQDLSGPKLRIGMLPAAGIDLLPGQECRLGTGPYEPGPPPLIPIPIPALLEALAPGHSVFLDDGQFELLVTEATGGEARCLVRHGGRLLPNKGLAAPATPFAISAITEKDMADLAFGLELGVDWIAVSFVRRAEDLAPVREALRRRGSPAHVIAKIEKPEAVANFQEILEASDGIMVARGDLGVEIPLHHVPMVQKELIRRSRQCGKPVITATQMLESMTHAPRPTRAEVSDVANAIVDGTSAVMLSAETAIGSFPSQAVATMSAIAEYTEGHLDYDLLLKEGLRAPADSITDAISQGVVEIAHDLGAAAILCSTTSGHTARMVARLRPRMPVIAATANRETYHRLPLYWGVRPLLVAATTSTDEMLAFTVRGALEAGWVQPGQTVVITLGAPVGTPGHTNLIKVERL